jgi:hypothetical protein
MRVSLSCTLFVAFVEAGHGKQHSRIAAPKRTNETGRFSVEEEHKRNNLRGLHKSCDGTVLAKQAAMPATPCNRTIPRGNICAMMVPIATLPNSTFSSSTRLHPDREAALLAHVPQHGSLLEVGTLYGDMAKFMLRQFRPSNLTVMDINAWSITRCKSWVRNVAREVGSELTCIRGDSAWQIRSLPDDSLDLAYIDGDHAYAGVCADLEAVRTKVKVGGLLVLNDYLRFEESFLARNGRWGVYGVIHAVSEFLTRYQADWEIAYYAFSPFNEGDFGMRRRQQAETHT